MLAGKPSPSSAGSIGTGVVVTGKIQTCKSTIHPWYWPQLTWPCYSCQWEEYDHIYIHDELGTKDCELVLF